MFVTNCVCDIDGAHTHRTELVVQFRSLAPVDTHTEKSEKRSRLRVYDFSRDVNWIQERGAVP